MPTRSPPEAGLAGDEYLKIALPRHHHDLSAEAVSTPKRSVWVTVAREADEVAASAVFQVAKNALKDAAV